MATFAEEMVQRIEDVLRVSVGVQTVTFGGQTVTLSQLRADYEYWKGEAAKAAGRRPFMRPFTMQGP